MRKLWTVVLLVAVGMFVALILNSRPAGDPQAMAMRQKVRQWLKNPSSTEKNVPFGPEAIPALLYESKPAGIVESLDLHADHFFPNLYVRLHPSRSLIGRRMLAYNAMASMRAAATNALPFLLQRYGKERKLWDWLEITTVALGKHAPQATIPTLRQIRLRNDEAVWFHATKALIKLEPSGNMDYLIQDLSKDVSTGKNGRNRDACYLLSLFGPRAKSAIPVLAAASQNPATQDIASEALGKIGK